MPAYHGKQAVEHAVFGLVDGGEDTGYDDDGENVRYVEDNAQQLLAFDVLAGEYTCKNERQREGNHCNYHDQQNGVLHGADEIGVVNERLEVFKGHKGLGGRIGSTLKQRHTEHVQRGDNHEDDEQNHSGCNAKHNETAASLVLFHVLSSFPSGMMGDKLSFCKGG